MNSLETMLVGREIGDTITISENRVMSLNFHQVPWLTIIYEFIMSKHTYEP